MDYEKAIEIPFGANDSELIKWEYTIPEGMEAEIKDGKVIIKKTESENERIRKFLVDYFASYKIGNVTTKLNGVRIDDILNYLEKQKENPKSSDSIPSNFTADANSKDRWHKTVNSLPDNGRDVLAKDALGNYLLASFDGAQWFVSVYDGEDHPVLHTPPILEWCEIPSENQKEQKDTSASTMVPSCWEVEQKEQKPAEWSEEDEEMLNVAIKSCEQTIEDYPNDKVKFKDCIVWLKSLRPFWKPTEEQMEKEKDGWCSWREAMDRLNSMKLGIMFYGGLFTYLRTRGKLDGLCKLDCGAKRVWLYDVMGIAEKVKKGELKYKRR